MWVYSKPLPAYTTNTNEWSLNSGKCVTVKYTVLALNDLISHTHTHTHTHAHTHAVLENADFVILFQSE